MLQLCYRAEPPLTALANDVLAHTRVHGVPLNAHRVTKILALCARCADRDAAKALWQHAVVDGGVAVAPAAVDAMMSVLCRGRTADMSAALSLWRQVCLLVRTLSFERGAQLQKPSA